MHAILDSLLFPSRVVAPYRIPALCLLAGALLWAALTAARPALRAGDGLTAQYYANATWKNPPAFTSVDAQPSTAQMMRRWNRNRPNTFSVVWTGYLNVARSGVYGFAMTSDDGSWLYIDNQLVVDNSGEHSSTTRAGRVQLSRGAHHVRLEYVQFGGDLALDWSWERKGSGFNTVPAWALSQQAVTYPTAIAAYFVDQARPVAAALSVLGAIWCVVVGLRLSAVVAVVGYGLPALFILHAITFWGRGIMDEEATGFIINYLAKRPLAAIIFDPRLNDYGLYQARELSYFFDYADARVFAALLDRHILSFIPFSGAFGLIMAAAIYLHGTRRVLRLDDVTAGLLLALFLSCIVTQASTAIFYRSAKMVLTAALLAFLFQLTELVRERDDSRRVSRWKLAGLFLLGLMMSVLDRQGVFYLVLATTMVGIVWAKKSIQMARVQTTHLRVLLASLCTVAAAVLYNNVVAPRIILSTNGYWPDVTYQEMPFSRLDWNLVSAALQMSMAQVSYFFGNAPFFVVCLLCAIVWVGASWDRSRRADWSVTKLLTSDVLVVSLISFGALVALLGLMILRHPPVFSIPDHSLWYYTLTIDAGLLFGTTLCVSQLDGPHGVRGKPVVYMVLLLMIASNAAHYGEQRKVMIDSQEWFGRQYVSSQNYLQQFLNGSPSWIRVGASGAIVELPIQQTGFLDKVEAAHATLVNRSALRDAGGPHWDALQQFLVGPVSPMNDPEQIASVVEAFRAIGVRQIVLSRDRYLNPEVAQETADGMLAPTGSIARASDDGRVLTIDLTNDRPEWPDEHGSRRIPPQSLRVTAEPETIRIDFDRPRAVRRIRISLKDQSLGDYPRKLVVEAMDGASVRGLYNGNPLGPVMRALLIQPVQPSIEIGLPANVSRMLLLRESGQTGSWNWSNHEVACFEERANSQ